MNSARNDDSMKIVDETMSEVRRNWNVMTQEDYNPITVAMEMLQKTNLAHDFSKFELLQSNLEDSMNIIIEKYYSGFNNAVSVFGGIVEKVHNSKSEVSKMKSELEAFRDQIQYKRTDLPELYSKIGAFKESVLASQKASELSSNRIKYIELTNEKFFIPASKILMESFDILKTYKIESADTFKLVLQEDKKQLTGTILDELLQHVFLKKSSASTEFFSKTFQEIPNLQDRIGILPDEYSFTYMELSTNGEKDLIMAPEEFDFKPDSSSLIFVSSLLQALNTLGTLEECLENIEQRISSELYLIVEDEIKNSASKLKKVQRSRDAFSYKFVLIPTGLNNVSRDEFYLFCPILREMCSVILAKLLVIVNVFKFITLKIDSFKTTTASSSNANIGNIESPLNLAIQAALREVKNFISSIIYSYSSPSEVFSNPLSDISNILKNSKSKSTNDNADLFTFSLNIDENLVSKIKSMHIRVNEKEKETSKKIAAALNIDPYTSSKKDLGHRQIVKPNIQYLQVLYNHTVAFLDILKDFDTDQRVDTSSNIFTSFSTIMEKEYIPFVESYMIHELVSAFKGSDSFNWVDFSDTNESLSFDSSIGKKSDSILCSYLTFVRLMCDCCKLIYFIPSYQELFESIMEKLCDQLLDKSEIRLRDLILVKYSGEDDAASNLLCFSVQFAKNPEIRDILSQNTFLNGSQNQNYVQINSLLSEKEALVMERLKGDRSIGKNELIFDSKVIRELALLQRSFEQVKKLIFMGKSSATSSAESMTKIVQDPETKNLVLHVYENGRKAIFKLGDSFDAKFSIFMELLDKLALTCLYTLRCEIRTHAFYFFDLAFREGSYKLEMAGFNDCNEPDPYILSWTTDILSLSDSLSDWFPVSKYLFLFDGLSVLIDSILVNNFQYIKSINKDGLRKLTTNTTAIIQVLTQIIPPSQVSLPDSTEYYHLAQTSKEELMHEIQACGSKYTFLQYRALLNSAYHEALQQEDNEAARKSFANHLTTLKYITNKESKE